MLAITTSKDMGGGGGQTVGNLGSRRNGIQGKIFICFVRVHVHNKTGRMNTKYYYGCVCMDPSVYNYLQISRMLDV